MLHPLLHLIATRPQLLADHAEAYGELFGAEFGRTLDGWKRRATLLALALCSAAVAATLAGVALMLWALLPPPAPTAAVLLVAVPLLPLLLAVAFARAARHSGDGGPVFAELRRQLQADMGLLREAAAP